MSASRLLLAAEAGLFDPEAGRALAFRPPADTDLTPLVPQRTVVAHGHRPAHDAFVASGWTVVPEPVGEFDTTILFLPRSKALGRAMIADAAERTAGRIVIDGAKTDGVEGILREVRAETPVSEVISKAHGKIFAIEGAHFPGWRAEPVKVDGFRIDPGLFSAGGPDAGSRLLAAHLPPLAGRVADLGAGWGYLSSRILASPEVSHLDAVEAEHAGITCIEANIPDPRLTAHWADARRWRPSAPLDAVVTNPPFHDGRRADPSLGRAFIEAAAGMLSRRGSLWLVANRHLPYEETLHRAFRSVREIAGDSAFKLIEASESDAPMR